MPCPDAGSKPDSRLGGADALPSLAGAKGSRAPHRLGREAQHPQVLSLQCRQSSRSLTRLVIVLRDITHESEVARLKNGFLCAAAHALRTPLTSVQGFLKPLQRHDAHIAAAKRLARPP